MLADSGDWQSSGQKLRKGVRIYFQWYVCTLCDDFSLKENGEQVDCNFKLWRYSQVGSDSIFEISTTCDYRRESLWTYKTYCNLEIKEGMGHSCLSGGLNDLSCYIFKLAISSTILYKARFACREEIIEIQHARLHSISNILSFNFVSILFTYNLCTTDSRNGLKWPVGP